MSSESEFLNASLAEIGASKITAIDDGSPNANYCKVFYPPLLRMILRLYNWNFAGARASLNQNVTAPLFEYSYSYPLPSDYIKMRQFNGYNIHVDGTLVWTGTTWVQQYLVEGENILTNDGTVNIVYTKLVTDPSLWDAVFYQIIQTWLASKLAKAIPKDDKKAASLLMEVTNLLIPYGVTALDQESSGQIVESNSLIWGR